MVPFPGGTFPWWLSGSERCRASDLGSVKPDKIDFGAHLFDDWTAPRRYGASLFPAGLSRLDELDPMIVVRPARWGDRSFDEVRQTFVWELVDKAGESVPLEVVYGDFNDPVIETLGDSLAILASDPSSPAHLLRSRYLCQVHRQAAVRQRLEQIPG